MESAALLKRIFQDALLLMGFAFRQLFQTVSQFCTSLEFDDFLGSDFNLLLSGRIDTCASRTLCYSESTKAQESYLITLFKCVSNGVEGCVERFFSVSLAQFCTCSNGIYEIGFVHEIVVFRNFYCGVTASFCIGCSALIHSFPCAEAHDPRFYKAKVMELRFLYKYFPRFFLQVCKKTAFFLVNEG